MSGRVPKKRDLFNRGKGIDLYDETSMDYQVYHDPSSPFSDNERQGNSMEYSSGEYQSERHLSSPTYSPTPMYVQSPTSTYHIPYNHLEESREPLSPSIHYGIQRPIGISAEPTCSNFIQLPSHPTEIPTHIPAHIRPAPPDSYTVRPIFAAPAYSGGVIYPPLRPVDPNGLYAVAPTYEGSSQTIHGLSHSGGDGPKKKKRQQNCSLCSNHDIQVEVKGHKWFCPYRDCKCERCAITRGRQHHMKEQQKLTRDLKRKNETK